MKSIITGILAAVAIALCAALVLDTEFQVSATKHFQTESVRL
ncbi:hypothetical protein [Paracraurococcus lichenis]|uniref:Uncharacterized protein n=1 Tax=Paracraurococcus lichenis TaxID=3064888 RepID=A0ABT9DT78_9PROT|nr:hypothetical protein [Paracraurococcus sp. LOR1-02]MDO9707099.1 hypothetical protein [Paracraurococcus sp. LOR1-02]